MNESVMDRTENNNVTIEIDSSSGFCFGVVNAISKAESSLSAGEVYSLGDIVHNRLEVNRLEKLGLHTVGHSDFPAIAGRRLLIRAHGEPPATYSEAEHYHIEIIDATCPVVASLQRTVAAAYEQMRNCGGRVVILGKKGHAEVVGLSGHAEGNALIVEKSEDLDAVDYGCPIYFLAQTTQSVELFREMADIILSRSECPQQVVIRDTICRQVANREVHLREFAGRFDRIVFVSGRESSNGKVLYGVCRDANPNTYSVEDERALQPEWFENCRSVGICGATSTPQWLMEQVARRIASLTSHKLL